MNKLFWNFLFASIVVGSTHAQTPFPYSVELKPITIPGVSGLHSYTHAHHDGKILVIGGRKDGIHARQPFNAFPQNQNNERIYVIDFFGQQVWSTPLQVLPTSISEQLQSTNMCFFQVADTLYIAGGYAFSPTVNDHITFPKLTTVTVSQVIQAVIQQADITPFFHQTTDERMAVTGGTLVYFDNEFLLVGGHRFDGRYNPMGNATYTQTYTDEIRKFKVVSSVNPVISSYSTYTDGVHLHRRDYNIIPQRFADESTGWMISAGVFQVNVDLPFLYPVEIHSNGIVPRTDFNQFLSHYHSAKANLYDSINGNMQTLFFGGLSQYQYANGTLVQDNQVPFVRTISLVNRDQNDLLTEYQLPEQMPGLKGTGAEFFPNFSLARYENEILKAHTFTADTTIIGHIYGGIMSASSNPFSNNQVSQTQADVSIYQVRLIKNKQNGIVKLEGTTPYAMTVSPNPVKNTIHVTLSSPILEKQPVEKIAYFLVSNEGKIIQQGETPLSGTELQIPLNKKMNHQTLTLELCINDRFYLRTKILVE